MLCQFSFQNFKSYKEETTFDFQAFPISEFSDSLITKETCNSFLPIGVIYGPNGGGKTNLLQALSCVISTVVKPIHDLEKNRKSLIMQQKVNVEPFLYHSLSAKEPTEFQIFFQIKGYEYRYYLALLKDEVVAEILDRKKLEERNPFMFFIGKEKKLT